jgi:outer membrane protein assembly factor BamB
MVALESQTGQQVWFTPANSQPPVIAAGVAAPLQQNGLAALSLPGHCTDAGCGSDTLAVVQLSTGNVLWTRDFNPVSGLPVTIAGDQVVVPQSSHTSSGSSSQLVAYALQTGTQAWVYALGHA